MLMPFLTLTESTEGVDDPHSGYYNRVVDASTIPVKDWVSSEKMLTFGEVYRIGVIIEHNWANPLPGAGSCIFLHPWRSMNQGTSGCTALDVGNVRQIVCWLDPSKNPILVQMPQSHFSKLGWDLGELSVGR
jgi:D-alanyl-D-alanine dipeptidase